MEQKHKKKQGKLLSSLADALSTHPPSKERVKQMKKMAKRSKKIKGQISSNDFKKAKSMVQKLMKKKA